MLKSLGNLEQAGHAGRVIVGTIMNKARGAVAVVCVAIANVVVVGADDD